MRLRRAAKPPTFFISPLPHALATHYFLRLTRARRQWFGRRTARVLLADFWYFWSHKSTIKEKFLYVFSRANDVCPYSTESKLCQHPKQKIRLLIRFFFCICRRKRKSYEKENAERRFRALRSATRTPRPRPRKPLKRLDLNFMVSENFVFGL